MTAEPKNNGFEETKGDEKDAGNPEGTTSQFSNPVEDPDRQDEREGEIALPEEQIIVVDVPLTNSVRHVRLQQVRSSKGREYNLYKVVSSEGNILDGKVVKSGKLAYAFRSTSQGIIACCARFVSNGKGTYKPILKNNKIVITRGGELAPVFQNYEKICLARQIVSSTKSGFEKGKQAVMSANKAPVAKKPVAPKPVTSARKPVVDNARRNAIKQSIIAQNKAKQAIDSKAQLIKLHEAEERQRLFQSSQTQMNEEKVAIKSANVRNTAALDKLYKGMF